MRRFRGNEERKENEMKKPNEFYVVAWTDFDPNAESVSCGFLSGLYSTLAKARKAVKNLVLDAAKDDMECYDKSNWMEVFGTEDAKEVAKMMTTIDQQEYIMAVREDGVESYYKIRKFDGNIVK